jgi:hypothetical protein
MNNVRGFNGSRSSTDARSILRIIYEKANFGAAPVSFKIEGDDRDHPCQFVKNPALSAVTFSDGSTVYVDSRTVDGHGAGGGADDPDSRELSDHSDQQALDNVEQQISNETIDSVADDTAEQGPDGYYNEPRVDLTAMFQTPASNNGG